MKKLAAFALVALLISPAALFAADREFKITTYYPAPFGEYKQVKANTLEVSGTGASVVIADGTQSANRVLTSDAGGKASWQTPGSSNPPDYDSGWFNVSVGTKYTKPHPLGAIPERVVVFTGNCDTSVAGTVCPRDTKFLSDQPGGPNGAGGLGPVWWQDASNIYVFAGLTGSDGGSPYPAGICRQWGDCNHDWGTCYYRILAWKKY